MRQVCLKKCSGFSSGKFEKILRAGHTQQEIFNREVSSCVWPAPRILDFWNLKDTRSIGFFWWHSLCESRIHSTSQNRGLLYWVKFCLRCPPRPVWPKRVYIVQFYASLLSVPIDIILSTWYNNPIHYIIKLTWKLFSK